MWERGREGGRSHGRKGGGGREGTEKREKTKGSERGAGQAIEEASKRCTEAPLARAVSGCCLFHVINRHDRRFCRLTLSHHTSACCVGSISYARDSVQNQEAKKASAVRARARCLRQSALRAAAAVPCATCFSYILVTSAVQVKRMFTGKRICRAPPLSPGPAIESDSRFPSANAVLGHQWSSEAAVLQAWQYIVESTGHVGTVILACMFQRT